MEQTKWFYLLLAVCLMFAAVFTGPVSAQDEEDPCIAAGTCEDTAGEEEEPAEDFFTDEEGIFITADGTTESLKLENSIDAAEAGAVLTARNRGKITLVADDEEGVVGICGAEAGIDITAEDAGSSVSVSSIYIDSDALGLAVFAGDGTKVEVTNEEFIGGNNAVDIVNDGGTVNVSSGALDAVTGIAVLTGAGETTVDTDDITANGYGVILDISEAEGLEKIQAPKVTVTVDGDITDVSADTPEEGSGFEPDDPGEEAGAEADDDGASDGFSPSDEEWWEDADEDPEDWSGGDDWESGEGWAEEDDAAEVLIENSVGIFINSSIKGAAAEVNVTGGISMAYGNEVYAENGSDVKVTVGEDVVTDYGNRIAVLDSSSADFSFGGDVDAGGRAIDTYTDSGTLTVSVAGDIIAQDSDESDYETVGIYTDSEGNGNTEITVGKGINVSSKEEDYTAFGISAANIGGAVTIDVAEDMTVSGQDAVGIYLINDPDGSAFWEEDEESEDTDDPELVGHAVDQPPVTKITINGKVAAVASNGGTGAEIRNRDGMTDLLIYGDLSGTEYGLDVSAYGTDRNASFADILVTGTISGKEAGLIVNDEADSDGNEDDNLNLTVWKITPAADGVIAGNEDGAANENVEKNIKYIIRIADGQEDKIKAVDENGNELPVSHGYYYENQGQRVYLEALNGYDLTEAYNGVTGQTALPKDEDGRFYLDVPNGGAVWLSAEKQPEPQPEPVDPQNPIDFYPIGGLSWLNDVRLPGTGFPASHVTDLSARPQGLTYGMTGMMLQIPVLNVAEPIVVVPEENGSYPVEWLNDSVGLLEQSSLPGEGVTVLTGHNHLNTTEVGPFLFIGEMELNDRIIITDADNSMLSYKVYGNYKIASDGFSEIADAVRENALVLITCEDESVDGGYLNRRVILAEPL